MVWLSRFFIVFSMFFHWVPTLSGFPRMELGNISGNVGPILLSDLASASKSCQILLESRWDELNAVSSMEFSKPWESGCQNTIPGVSQSKCHYGSGRAANVGQSSGKRQYVKSLSDDGAILEGNGHLAAPRKNLNFVGHWLFVAKKLIHSLLTQLNSNCLHVYINIYMWHTCTHIWTYIIIYPLFNLPKYCQNLVSA